MLRHIGVQGGVLTHLLKDLVVDELLGLLKNARNDKLTHNGKIPAIDWRSALSPTERWCEREIALTLAKKVKPDELKFPSLVGEWFQLSMRQNNWA